MDRSDQTLDRMRTFVRVADRGSLSAVARELGTGQSTITRRLRELEDALGAPLLSRTTRSVTLTDEGSRYYARCSRILALVDEAAAEVRDTRSATAGTVRVSCTAALGVLHITRLIFAFQDQHPEVKVELSLNDQQVDLVREGVDVAIRLGPLADSTMKLQRLGESKRFLVASPAYLARRGRPAVPADLGSHDVIRMSNVVGSDRLSLTGPDGTDHSIAVDGRLRVDHGLAAREAMLAGQGIAPAQRWLVDDLMKRGEVEPVLPQFNLPPTPLNMLIVPERTGITRVRLLIAHLSRHIPGIPGIATIRR